MPKFQLPTTPVHAPSLPNWHRVTDTEVGKTFATCALINRASRSGLRAVGLKPIAAGTDAHGVNDDVARITAANTVELPEHIISPACCD